MITFRTHTCGELNKAHKGQLVSLSGGYIKKRSWKSFIFRFKGQFWYKPVRH